MKRKQIKVDSDTLIEWESLRIAAKSARKLAKEMRTPFYVVKNGVIVDLNGVDKRKRKAS